MTPREALAKQKDLIANLEQFHKNKVPEIIGTEAVNHYQQSFEKEGKIDSNAEKWPDVKRRDPNSEWYGFSYIDKKKQFSPTRARDKVLTGSSGNLKRSITYIVKSDRVTIKSDSPYASVHNFGGSAKVFGKKAFTMKPRPFIYRSTQLEKAIKDKIINEIKKLLK